VPIRSNIVSNPIYNYHDITSRCIDFSGGGDVDSVSVVLSAAPCGLLADPDYNPMTLHYRSDSALLRRCR